jgi:bifunctional non-homologous end joining protein LigD
VRAGRVRLYTMNAADWTERYARIVEEAARLKRDAILDCEVICTDEHGRVDLDRLQSRCFEHEAIACAFDLLKLDGEDLRRRPLAERKAGLRRLLKSSRGGIQYVNRLQMEGEEAFEAACGLGLEGIVSKRLGTLQIRSVQKLDQAPPAVVCLHADSRGDVLVVKTASHTCYWT